MKCQSLKFGCTGQLQASVTPEVAGSNPSSSLNINPAEFEMAVPGRTNPRSSRSAPVRSSEWSDFGPAQYLGVTP